MIQLEENINHLKQEIKTLKEEIEELKKQISKINEEIFPDVPETDLLGNKFNNKFSNQLNKAYKNSVYQPTLSEEMNLNGDPNTIYMGKGLVYINRH